MTTINLSDFGVIPFDKNRRLLEITQIVNLGFGCRFEVDGFQGLAYPVPLRKELRIQLLWMPVGDGSSTYAAYQHMDNVRTAITTKFLKELPQRQIKHEVLRFFPARVRTDLSAACYGFDNQTPGKLWQQYLDAIKPAESIQETAQKQTVIERTHALIAERLRMDQTTRAA